MTFCVSSTYGYPKSRKNSLNRAESSSGAWMPARTLPRSSHFPEGWVVVDRYHYPNRWDGKKIMRTCAMIPVME
jgi:hypothetical protein